MRSQPINLLEVGIGVAGQNTNNKIVRGRNTSGGASLKMWAEYFPFAHVYGIDINPANHLDTARISTTVCDQSQEEALRALVARLSGVDFDVIIDDGSHRAADQQLTLGVLFPKLALGGHYFIEDLGSESGAVTPTRQVLRSFQESGHFGTPNSLADADYLGAWISWIQFHAPVVKVVVRSGYLRPFRPLIRLLEYRDDTDRLCTIRKRITPAQPLRSPETVIG
jgi:hypothetical protein